MNPLVSIIIPVYKVEKYIHRCMNSILNQTYKNLEIILVDDGSPDNCPEICNEYASVDKRIKVIHKKNGGLSDARNKGLKIVSGDYVFFVDSDDFINLRTIEYMIFLAIDRKANLVQCDRELGHADNFSNDPFATPDKIKIYNNTSIFESSQNKVSIWAKLYETSLWDNVEMPVGKLNEDDFTTWKIYYKANRIVVTNYQLYYNYINPEGICSTLKKVPNLNYPLEAYHERIKFFDDLGEKHLSDLSKWRFMKYILLANRNSFLSSEQKSILRKEFWGIWTSVLRCTNVPLAEKIIICIYAIYPSLSNFLLRNIK